MTHALIGAAVAALLSAAATLVVLRRRDVHIRVEVDASNGGRRRHNPDPEEDPPSE